MLTEKTKQNFVFCIVLFFTDLWSYITICFTCFGFFLAIFLTSWETDLVYQISKFYLFFLIFKGINFLQNITLPYSKSFLTCVFKIFHLFLNAIVILSLLLNHLKISKYLGNQGLSDIFEVFHFLFLVINIWSIFIYVLYVLGKYCIFCNF